MPSQFQSHEPEQKFNSKPEQPPQSASGEIVRYDEAMQQQIIALAGQLQDRERATVSLEQLEGVAEEVGLEPRFVREAARRLAAPQILARPTSSPTWDSPRRESSPPPQQDVTQPLSREESLAAALAAAERAIESQSLLTPYALDETQVYDALAENNFDSSPTDDRVYVSLENRINEELIEGSSSEPLLGPLDVNDGVQPIESSAPVIEHVPLTKALGPLFAWALVLTMTAVTLIVYGITFLCFFTPLVLSTRVTAALVFGLIAAYLTRATKNLWRDMGLFRRKK